jgi:hypothetical protein
MATLKPYPRGTSVAVGKGADSIETFSLWVAPIWAAEAPANRSISARKSFHFPLRISTHPSEPPTWPFRASAPS